MVGYLNYTNVSGPRWHKAQPRHHGGGNDAAVSRIFKEKLARVTPKEWTEDPYFMCVLLSLAQLQEGRPKPPSPTSHLVSAPCPSNCHSFYGFVSLAHISKSRLLVASPLDREFIHLYEARITSDFLGMLDNPATATMQNDSPTIRRRQIPFKPFETLQERILAELSAGHKIPPHVPIQHDDTINQNVKRVHEHEDDEMCKRGRTS